MTHRGRGLKRGSKINPKREEKQYVNKYRGENKKGAVKDLFLSPSISFPPFRPFLYFGLSAFLDSNLLSTPVTVNKTRLE